MREPDLERLDRLVEEGLAPERTPGAGAAAAQPDWSRTLVAVLERFLVRLERLEADVEGIAKAVDVAAARLAHGLADVAEPVQRTEHAVTALGGRVEGIDAELRQLRDEIARMATAVGA